MRLPRSRNRGIDRQIPQRPHLDSNQPSGRQQGRHSAMKRVGLMSVSQDSTQRALTNWLVKRGGINRVLSLAVLFPYQPAS